MKWESVEYYEYENGNDKPGVFTIPDYLDPEPLEVIGNIMYTVTGLVFSNLQIPDMDIEKTLREISTDREKKLWSIYILWKWQNKVGKLFTNLI